MQEEFPNMNKMTGIFYAVYNQNNRTSWYQYNVSTLHIQQNYLSSRPYKPTYKIKHVSRPAFEKIDGRAFYFIVEK